MTTDDVIDRIRKLLRLARDAGATEAEAAAALERANALLIRHNLTMDRVAVSTGEKPSVTDEPMHTGRSGSWRVTLLASILAPHNLCAALVQRLARTDTVIVIGRPANVAATHEMFDWIAAQLERLAEEEWQSAKRNRDATVIVGGFSWKTAFLRGALLRIWHRLGEQRKAQEQPAPSTPSDDQTPPGAAITALVLRTEQENTDYMRQRFGKTQKKRARSQRYVTDAYVRGKQRGADVSLAPMKTLRARPGC
jgi:hypothetical protein